MQVNEGSFYYFIACLWTWYGVSKKLNGLSNFLYSWYIHCNNQSTESSLEDKNYVITASFSPVTLSHCTSHVLKNNTYFNKNIVCNLDCI